MTIRNPAPIIFAVLALIFLALVLSDIRKHGLEAQPARKAWLRVGLIFSAIAVLLAILQAGR